MTLTASALFLLLALTMLIGGMLGYWFRDGAELWRARLEAESAKYRRYRGEAEAMSAQNAVRIAQLEAAYMAATGRAAPPHPASVTSAEVAAAPVAAADRLADMAAAGASTLADAASAAAHGPHDAALSASQTIAQSGTAPLAPATAMAGGMMAAAASAFPARDETPDPAPAEADALMTGHQMGAPMESAPADLAPDAPASAEPAARLSDPLPDHVFLGDDLTRIRSIDDDLASNLQALGVHRFSDIETMSAIDELALEQRLKLPAGFITAEQWRLQAALLAADIARAQGIARELPSDA